MSHIYGTSWRLLHKRAKSKDCNRSKIYKLLNPRVTMTQQWKDVLLSGALVCLCVRATSTMDANFIEREMGGAAINNSIKIKIKRGERTSLQNGAEVPSLYIHICVLYTLMCPSVKSLGWKNVSLQKAPRLKLMRKG
uniref:Uncharacterized protein n=1 Tax=Glypta fumiferanae TaxID=389681 RepID=A0A0F6Q8Y3_9HYME|nr:hypothetical protein [Glypta fumiferanae]